MSPKKVNEYNHTPIERKWQKEWEKKQVYKTENPGKKKKHYVLDMFPYPSGAGLHVGHPRGYIGTDVYARMKRMQGFNVLHPMGYDAFGLPAEQFAIANKIHPRKAVEKNVATFERQLSLIGLSYDWSRKINTTDPGYYKWTQWIFLKLYDAWYDKIKNKARPVKDLVALFKKKGTAGVCAATSYDKDFTAKEWKTFSDIEKQNILMHFRLAYEGYSDVNWSPSMGTVLANDEILDTPSGPVAERDGKPVVKKRMRQWFMRITAYAERLLEDLEGLDWNDNIKEIQRNWIGKSEGALIPFPLSAAKKYHFVILHGYTGRPTRDFLPWLKKELEDEGHSVEVPVLPNPDMPTISEQIEYVLSHCRLDENTIVVAHSLGTVVAMKAVESLKKKIAGLVLVAPFYKPEFKDYIQRAYFKTFNWKFDFPKIFNFVQSREHAASIVVLRDLEDHIIPNEQPVEIAKQFGIPCISTVAKKTHFKGESEPRILEAIKQAFFSKRILVGTRNEAKFKMVKACFPKTGNVELVSLNDIAPVDDSALVEGSDYEENARMKAEFYFKKTGIPTISTDNIFWLEKWGKDNGILVHMRKEANPKSPRATDEEVLAWLKKWVKSVGGKSKAHFKYAVAFADIHGTRSFTSVQREYILQPKQSKKFWSGYPTESLLLDAVTGEYKGEQKDSVRYKNLISDFIREAPLWFGELPTVKAFTTRADTLASAFALILSPEHPLIQKIIPLLRNASAVKKYVEEVSKKTEEDRTNTEKEKTGVPLEGIYTRNPLTGEELPVWIADFVLAQYGTGVIFADMHDERDFMFAKKYGLPMRQSIMPVLRGGWSPPRPGKEIVQREVVHVIVRNLKEKTVLVGFLKDNSWGDKKPVNFIIGGVEEGETLEETARREIREETGYTDVCFVEQIPLDIQAEFFQAQKNVNRVAHVRTLVFDLVSEKKVPVSEEEQAKHDFKWVPESEVSQLINVEDDTLTWSYLQSGGFAYVNEGIVINSGEFDGLTSEEARPKIVAKAGGEMVTKYKMRDAVFARQRYWGEPIPLKHSTDGTITPLKEKELPLTLPNVSSYEPTGTGESPLASVSSWVKAGYETNTMPGWAGSSWYFLRYADPINKKEFASKKALNYWFGKKDGGVDMYVGGAEHATGHLLYARFWHKFLYDCGFIQVAEPFRALRNQGMIGGADGRKMSKRWGNVVNPDDVVQTYGADSLRVFEMFLGPFDSHLPWSTEGIVGCRRFIEKTWRLAQRIFEADIKESSPDAEKSIHRTIKKVTEDIANFNFNTAVSAMMICVNELEKIQAVSARDFSSFLKILAPFAPHVTEELWTVVGKGSIHRTIWPDYDAKKLIENTMRIVVSVNGKARTEIIVPTGTEQSEIERLVRADERANVYLSGKEIVRIIYVPNKLINLVIR